MTNRLNQGHVAGSKISSKFMGCFWENWFGEFGLRFIKEISIVLTLPGDA